MKKSSQKVIDWRKRTKARMVEAMGGSCACCGYNQHVEIFQFHHLDPSVKRFTMGNIRASPKKWSTIVEELRKCVMLCANCHAEVEYCGRSVPNNAPRFNEKYADYRSLEK